MYLARRTFDDCLDRLADIQRNFSSALLIGCPDPEWRTRLEARGIEVTILDPGPLFARAAAGSAGDEDEVAFAPASFELCIAVGTLDTVPSLPHALSLIRRAVEPGGLFLAAMAGGNSLPCLRAAMRAADRTSGAASAHVHPRIEASAIAPLLDHAGFAMPVIDVDRVEVAYRDLDRLVRDLRGMGATNILAARARRPLSRIALAAARLEFARLGDGHATREQFEILHIAAWVPSSKQS